MLGYFKNKKQKVVMRLLKKLEEKAEKDPKLKEKLINLAEKEREKYAKKGIFFDDEGNRIKQ